MASKLEAMKSVYVQELQRLKASLFQSQAETRAAEKLLSKVIRLSVK